jgi:DNA-directed RNA polymerase specialized sigma24 family protein
MDRAILELRCYEQISSGDASLALGLSIWAASNRYSRAFERLETILNSLPGGMSGSEP